MSDMVPNRQKSKTKIRQLQDLFKGFWQWTSIYNVFFAASLTLFVFVRFLDFFITPTINKIFVFISIFTFFFIVSLFVITPILNGLKAKRKLCLIIVFISLVITGVLYILLPVQKFSVRTLHTLEVSITPDSGPVVFENFIGPIKTSIPWTDVTFDGTIYMDSVTIPPGGELFYSREMTGGLSFMLSTSEKDSEAIVVWDGVKTVVPIPVGVKIDLVMDSTSLGILPKPSQFLLLAVKINEWVCLFLTLILILGSGYLILKKSDFHYRIVHWETLRYLGDYLILSGVLILFAIVFRAYRPDTLTKNLYIVLPSFFYLLLKIIYWVVPSLSIVLFSLILLVNIFAHYIWFDKITLRVRNVDDRTFNRLVRIVYPSDTTVMSLGFFQQLRDSELILAQGSFLAEDENVARLNRINYHENIYILDYPGELSIEDYERLLQLNDWSTWNRGRDGTFYFYKAELAVTTPIVVFTYLDDILLIPEEQLDDLGLFNDFIFD
ncbi:hypothetical protein JR338_08610 [Chloroflexota bacterium]|nr:hypothetical protein JR338_08610 [Chloroflexota bacterium]